MTKSKAAQLAAVAQEVLGLEASPFYVHRQENHYHAVIGEGDEDAEILFVGEAPGEQEAKSGRPFVGAAGRMLNELLASINLRREDVYITNIVKDRPPNNRDPRPDEIALYAPFLLKQIAIIQPRVIATLGRFAMAFILERFQPATPVAKISQLHGQVIRVQAPYGEVMVVPLYHPAVALYNREQRQTLEEDFQVLKQYASTNESEKKAGAAVDHSARPSNEEIAALLDQTADLLETQETNAFRVQAYRNGANIIRAAKQPVAELARAEDMEALVSMPNIGEGLARVIIEFVNTGRSAQLERLQGETSPAALFTQVPGIGEELAQRIEQELGIHTLEELEQAGYDGRLEQVEGFGPKRVKAVLTSLAGLLSRSAQRHQQSRTRGERPAEERPPVELLLEIDTEYRRRANKNELPTIAPKRFNPDNESWLPVMNADRDGWSFDVLFSNTARAHELEMTRDWVVIYYKRNGREAQNTVVTETNGPLAGRRVVRGREAETRAYYADQGNQ